MNRMTRMFSEAMCLPITTFATGMETIARSMQCGGWSDWSRADCGDGLSCPDRHERGDRWSSSCDGGSSSWSWDHDGEDDDRGAWSCGCGCGCSRCRRGDCCGSSRRGSGTVKLVEYAVVRVSRGKSELLQGMKQRVIADCTSLDELRSEILVDYARDHRDADGKRLRVYVRVLDCWRKEDYDYDDEQIDALHEIRDAIRDKQ